jgi:hypothetical protein
MHKALLFLLCCLSQIGCGGRWHTSQQATYLPIEPVSTGRQPALDSAILQPFPNNELRELVNAANDFSMFGKPFPDHLLQRVKPVEIYNDLANVVVALHREAHEEQGYYIVTPISSYLPAGHDGGFSCERIDVSGSYPNFVYVYRRTR